LTFIPRLAFTLASEKSSRQAQIHDQIHDQNDQFEEERFLAQFLILNKCKKK
jgi:hypothetical protein